MSIERKTAANAISQSADIVAENLDKLKQLFPSVFTEGNIDFNALKELLGDKIETDPEYYRFTWPGKAMAKAEARKPSRGTLRPAKDESVNWDTTENLYIEGDNLEVLKLLQKSYANKVKMIYIDPPYNTGKDFVYKDNYKDNLSNYNEKFNRTDDEGNLKSSASETNQEGSARYHSNWLNMMYPRLTLARNLLTEDGVIFISIDDNEVENIRRICNEVFGEDNFVANFLWKRKKEISSDTKNVSIQGEYIVCFCKSDNSQLNSEKLSKEYIQKSYKDPNDEFTEGKWRPVPITVSKGLSGGGYNYKITNPNGTVHEKLWAYPEQSYKKLVEENRVYFGKDGSAIPQRVIYSKESKGQPTTNYWDNTASNKEGKKEVLNLFEGNNFFDTPKPTNLLKRILKLITSISNDIILDFFSGSASTAHAVMQLNAEDGGKRKHIQVQLPEPTEEKSEAYKAGYKTIADIGKERIRLAGKKILEENPEQKDNLDIGFKVFKLDESNIKTWETDPEKLDANLFLEDVIKDDRTEEDVLYEILLKYGLDLTLPIQEKEIEHQKLYAIGGGALLVYLGDNATPSIAQEIINWAKELGAINPQAVFKDSGFQNSQDKVNTLQLLKSNNITDVWSI